MMRFNTIAFASLAVALTVGQANGKIIARDGPGRHNGSYLDVGATKASGGVIVSLKFTCYKNFRGRASGTALVEIVGEQSHKYAQRTLSCDVLGSTSTRPASNTDTAGLFMAKNKRVIIVAMVQHRSKTAWEDWGASWSRKTQTVLNNLVEAYTDPAALAAAAKGVGGVVATM